MHRSIGAGVVLVASTLAGCEGYQAPTAPNPPPPAQSPATPPAPRPAAADDPLVGRYALTLDVGSSCGAIPDTARVRRYTAAIGAAAGADYVVTLGGSTFLTGSICTYSEPGVRGLGLGCDQFLAARNGDVIEVDLVNNNDYAHGGHIVEQLHSGNWIEIIGAAAGQFSTQTIEARGNGTVWYCRLPDGYPFPCAAVTSCRSNDLRLTFKRTP
jgi:hypothetical protein